MQQRFLTLLKDGQAYHFRYESGEETQLYLALMEYASDPLHCLNWGEVIGVIQEVDRLTALEDANSAGTSAPSGRLER